MLSKQLQLQVLQVQHCRSSPSQSTVSRGCTGGCHPTATQQNRPLGTGGHLQRPPGPISLLGQAHLDQATQEHTQAWDIFSEGAHTAPEQPVPCSITLITKIFLVIFKQSPLCYPPPLTLPQAAPQEGLPLPNPSPFQQLQTLIIVYINYKQHIAYTNYKINYSLYLRPPSPAHDHLLVEAVVQHQAVGECQAVRLHGVPGSCNHSDRKGRVRGCSPGVPPPPSRSHPLPAP